MKYTTTGGQLFFFAIVKNAPTDFLDEANTTALKKKHFQGNISNILCLRSIWTWAQSTAYFITLDLPISATKEQVWRRYIEVAKQSSQLGWKIHIFSWAKIQLKVEYLPDCWSPLNQPHPYSYKMNQVLILVVVVILGGGDVLGEVGGGDVWFARS